MLHFYLLGDINPKLKDFEIYLCFLSYRITVEEVGCQLILTHIKHREILNRLLLALDVTDSNRATNIAFAIARLLEEENGKRVLINDCGQNKFVRKIKHLLFLKIIPFFFYLSLKLY